MGNLESKKPRVCYTKLEHTHAHTHPHTLHTITCQLWEIFSLGLCASDPTPMRVSHLFTILSMGSFLLLHSSDPCDNVNLIHAMEEFKACQYYWEVHRLQFSSIYKYDNPLLC